MVNDQCVLPLTHDNSKVTWLVKLLHANPVWLFTEVHKPPLIIWIYFFYFKRCRQSILKKITEYRMFHWKCISITVQNIPFNIKPLYLQFFFNNHCIFCICALTLFFFSTYSTKMVFQYPYILVTWLLSQNKLCSKFLRERNWKHAALDNEHEWLVNLTKTNKISVTTTSWHYQYLKYPAIMLVWNIAPGFWDFTDITNRMWLLVQSWAFHKQMINLFALNIMLLLVVVFCIYIYNCLKWCCSTKY